MPGGTESGGGRVTASLPLGDGAAVTAARPACSGTEVTAELPLTGDCGYGGGVERPMTGSEIRVVIADDHPVVREGLSALLDSVPSITVAGVAGTGREAVQAAVRLRPDVLILDIQMPELSGIAATAEITRVAPDVAVLMLTMFDDDDSVFAAMRAGARGYVLKGAQQDEIVRAIHAVAAGQAIFGPGVARRVLGLVSAPPTPGLPFPALTEPGARGARPDRVRRAQRRDRPADVDRAEDRRQPRVRDLRQAAGGRPGRGHHRGQGRRPRPPADLTLPPAPTGPALPTAPARPPSPDGHPAAGFRPAADAPRPVANAR